MLRTYCLAFALGAIATLASARPTDSATVTPQVAQQALEDYVDCTLKPKGRRDLALKLLRTYPGDPRYTKGFGRLAENGCLPRGIGQMALRPDILRLALFTGLYRRDFGSNPVSSVKGYDTLNAAAEFDVGIGQADKVFIMVREVSDCVVRSKPSEVHALLLTKVMSPEEGRLWPLIVAELVKCNSSDTEFKMQKVTMRGTLAEALYKVRTIYAPRLAAQKVPNA